MHRGARAYNPDALYPSWREGVDRAIAEHRASLDQTSGGKRRHAPAKPRKAPRRRATSTPKRASRLAALVASINRMTR
jgi:hypothetical protein